MGKTRIHPALRNHWDAKLSICSFKAGSVVLFLSMSVVMCVMLLKYSWLYATIPFFVLAGVYSVRQCYQRLLRLNRLLCNGKPQQLQVTLRYRQELNLPQGEGSHAWYVDLRPMNIDPRSKPLATIWITGLSQEDMNLSQRKFAGMTMPMYDNAGVKWTRPCQVYSETPGPGPVIICAGTDTYFSIGDAVVPPIPPSPAQFLVTEESSNGV